MANVHVLRHKVLVEGLSRRQVAQELGISRNTVAKYLENSQPQRQKETQPRPRPATEALQAPLFDLLEQEAQRPRIKQHLTAPVLVELLQQKGLQPSLRSVQRLMTEWGRQRRDVPVPLVYPPGDLAEVDFFEVHVTISEKPVKAWLFLLRLMASGRDFTWLYFHQDTASFLDGHLRAFRHFGALPHRILYDNLRPAVQKILVGSQRLLQPRFLSLVSHFLFEPCFARPSTGSDKGGVEARGKGVRWRHLTPIPHADSLSQIAQKLLERIEADLDKPRDRGSDSVRQLWEIERPHLLPLPEAPYDPGVFEVLRASRQARVRLQAAWYSVPSPWAGLDVESWLYPDEVVLCRQGQRVVHPRQPKNGSSNFYRHYLRELARKPQALRQVAGELLKELGSPFDRVWREQVDLYGPPEAARRYTHILKAIERHGEPWVSARLQGALEAQQDPLLALRSPEETGGGGIALPPSLREVEVSTAELSAYDRWLGGEK